MGNEYLISQLKRIKNSILKTKYICPRCESNLENIGKCIYCKQDKAVKSTIYAKKEIKNLHKEYSSHEKKNVEVYNDKEWYKILKEADLYGFIRNGILDI